VAVEKPTGKPAAKPARTSRLNFKLELSCGCKPPICAHAGPGIAKLLSAAYAKGRVDGARDAAQGIAKVAAKAGAKRAGEAATIRVKQKGSTRAQ
jgi:hypothetical protein